MPSKEYLTQSQWLWCQCQMLLDDGVQACPACDALTTGLYCGRCGERLHPEPQPCPTCHLVGTGHYCEHCGTAIGSPITEAIAAGTYDWDAWAQSLRPFLGGFTATERRILAEEGVHVPG